MYDSQPATTVVPNRLSSVRELLHEQLRTWLPKFCVAVSNCDDPRSGKQGHCIETFDGSIGALIYSQRIAGISDARQRFEHIFFH